MDRKDEQPFELATFTPYLLAQAAEAQSKAFSRIYKNDFGMLPAEWRVLYHLGREGDMTAKEIAGLSALHKTRISRAVSALEQKRFIRRRNLDTDRRHEQLSLTRQGQAALRALTAEARAHDRALGELLGTEDLNRLKTLLARANGLKSR